MSGGEWMAGVDPYSRVRFEEHFVVREVRGPVANALERLLASPDRERVFDAGLSRFEVLSRTSDAIVVRSHRVWPVSYPHEWPSAALPVAAHALLAIARALEPLHLRLHDAHPWNLVFDGARPVFVDIGSVREGATTAGGWIVEFERTWLAPMLVAKLGGSARAERALHDPRRDEIHGRAWPERLLRPVASGARALGIPSVRVFDALAWCVDRVGPAPTRSAWSGYEQQERPLDRPEEFAPKQRTVHDVLHGLPPSTVLDLASNRGFYARMAAAAGHRVVASDVDDTSLSALFELARRDGLPITTMRFDLAFPRGSQGLGLAYGDVYERVRSDVVLALAILHHLVREVGITFDWFASLMARIARHGALVEFVPREDAHVSGWHLANPEAYRLDALVDALAARFTRVEVLPSSPEPRVLVWATGPR